MQNRRISFRVWVPEEKRFRYCDYISTMGFVWVIDGSPLEVGENYAQQYTGLKDINNQDIYEGDIVEYFDWCYASSHIPNGRNIIEWEFENAYGGWHTDIYYPLFGEVKWNLKYLTYEPLIFAQEDYNGNSFGMVCNCSNNGNHLLNSKGLPNYPTSYFKVIGNVCENPELLTRKE